MFNKAEITEQIRKIIEKRDCTSHGIKVLSASTTNVLERIHQNVVAQLQEDTAPIIQDFIVKLTGTLLSATSEFADKNHAVDLPVFPNGTRYIHRDGNNLDVVIEQPAQSRTVHLTVFNNGNPIRLSFPYTVFVMNFRNGRCNLDTVRVFCRARSLSNINDELAIMPLPNIRNDSGKLCFGSSHINLNECKDINEQCNRIIDTFWQSAFNADLSDGYVNFLRINKMNLTEWSNKTKENSLCSMQFNLQPANIKLQNTFSSNNQDNLAAMLKQNVLTAVGEIGGEVQKLLENLDVTSENREKVHIDTMNTVVKEIVIQSYVEMLEKFSAKLESERASDQEKNKDLQKRMKEEFVQWVRENYPTLSSSVK
jgi:hypothetical protein